MHLNRFQNDFVVVTFCKNATTAMQLISQKRYREAKDCFTIAYNELVYWHSDYKMFQGGITYNTIAKEEKCNNVLFLDWSKVQKLDEVMINIYNSASRYYMPHWIRTED